MNRFLSHIITSTWKEFKLLARDKVGLIVMFMMPSILVIIVTLVQENVMEMSGEKKSTILFLDMDNDLLANKLKKALLDTGRITLKELDGNTQSAADAKMMVQSGDFQLCIIVPEGSTPRLKERIDNLFDKPKAGTATAHSSDDLVIYFDPGVLPGFRSSISSVLQMAISSVEMDLKLTAFEQRSKRLLDQITPLVDMGGEPIDLGLEKLKIPLLTLTERDVAGEKMVDPISAVQHNIPSWSLFGLFFTAIPLAGSLLLERKSGIWRRLLTMPISPVTLLIGKIIAYTGVCFSQLLLIVSIGRFLFPFLGLPPFTIDVAVLPLICITLCCSLAACGYGILLGSACSTMEQASMFGSISIVVAAALGGTMVPSHAMPATMQKISTLSPLNWGLTSFQDILIRGYGLVDIMLNLSLLLLFFGVTLLISWRCVRSVG